MWLERFVIIVVSLQSRLPAIVVGHVRGHALGLRGLFGTIGLFFSAMFLFVRLMPMITIFEMRTLAAGGKAERGGGRP